MAKGDRVKHFGYAVCLSLALNIKYINNGENHLVQVRQVRQRGAGNQFMCFINTLSQMNHPFLASISETVEAFNYRLECGCVTDSGWTEYSGKHFFP